MSATQLVTTTEDETTQESEGEQYVTRLDPHKPYDTLPVIPEVSSESDTEDSEDSDNITQDVLDAQTAQSAQSVPATHTIKSQLLEQLNTPPTGRLTLDSHLYLLTGSSLTKFIRLTKYHTYGNQIHSDMATKYAIETARTQRVVAPLSAINTQDGELYVVDDIHQLMSLRNLSDGVLEKLTVMLIVYDFINLNDIKAKTLFARLNNRHLFTIDTHVQSDIEQFMTRILSQPAFRDGIKASGNKKTNFPNISATEFRKSLQEIIAQIQLDGGKPNIDLLANRLIDFNCICKGKPISTLFGLHVTSSSSQISNVIDDKISEKYKKMVVKNFYLASPYGRCWPQFLLGRPDTEIIGIQTNLTVPIVPVISPKLSFNLKTNTA